MSLTAAQLAALKADLALDAGLSANPNNQDGNQIIADAYNSLAVPDFWVWRNLTPVDDIQDQIVWSNYTPTDAVPTGTSTSEASLTYLNRSMLAQTKQMNLQNLLIGRTALSTNRTNVRNGLADATQNLTTGLNGANVTGGWVNVRTAIMRRATRLERLLATGTGTSQNPATCGTPGDPYVLTHTMVQNARNLP